MALRLNSITGQLGRLSIGISRTSVRFYSKQKRRGPIEPSFEPGHGEKIWIFDHILDGMTVYSHKPVLKANRALRQIPFNGKKLKPSKLRKDYWRPLAMIQFPEGYGAVGRSVFQRLRECKTLHELTWDDSLLLSEEGKPQSRHKRGVRLNNQKANTIADMAAVLGGAGKGNKIRVKDAESVPRAAPDAPPAVGGLITATVWWRNALDRNFATEWPANVSHELFEEAYLQPLERVEDLAEGEEGQDGEAGQKSHSAPKELVADEQLQRASEQDRRPGP